MKFQTSLLAGAALYALSAASLPATAQETTSSLRGTVVSSSGAPVSEATVTITHEPTGSATTLSLAADGRFFASGLRPGGPYTVKIEASGFQPEEVQQVTLGLDETLSISFDLDASDAAILDVVVVTGSASDLYAIDTGVGSVFGTDDVAQLPTISRDPKDIIRLDPRAVVTDGVQGQLSVAGLNQRYNSITIDGIRLNDDFGLNRSGNPGRANPVSIDAIDQIVVNIADYDVEASQYLGGNTNIITKSGTNEFHGSAYIFSRNKSLAGNLPIGDEPQIDDTTYGFTLGGPLWKDRVFFFANYEKFDTDRPVSTTPDQAGITDVDIAQFQDILQRVYGFDGGGVQLANTDDDERLLLKIDANIADGHRAVFTYTTDEATTVSQQESNTGNFALSSTYLTQQRDIEGYSGQLFSDWTDNFSTELIYSYKKATEDRNPANSDFAQFLVATPGGSFLHAGPRFPFQQNLQFNIYETLKAKGVYTIGDHVLKGGYEYQTIDVENNFVLFAPNGYYVFNSFADLEARTASAFMYENAPSGNSQDGGAQWGYNVHNLFLSDSWQVRDDLTVDLGVRVELYESDATPEENSGFVARNGFSNAQNLDGKSLIMPRVGLTWQPTDHTIVRAGAGIFSGGTPNVFYSNTYNRNGVSTAAVGVFRQPCVNLGAVADAICTNVDGFSVASEAQDLVVSNIGTGTAEALDPDYDIPSSWKVSAGVEHEFNLSQFGLGDGWYTHADVLYFRTIDGITVNVLGLDQSGSTFDGRPTFNVGTRDYLLTNTDEGESFSLSLGFEKEFDTGWNVFAAYTYTDADDADSAQGSVLSDFTRVVATDPNSLPATTSTLEVENRFIFGANYTHNWFDEYATRIGVFGEHRSGLPFSYRFGNNPFGSQTTAPFYVPLENDPNVSYADAATQVAIDGFIADNGLEGYRGQVLSRNAFTGDDVTKIDLRFAQELPGLWDGSKVEFLLDIDNFTNLLNEDWGVERAVSGGSFGTGGVRIANVAYDATTDVYTYSGGPDASAGDDSRIVQNNSFWSIQMGFRLKF